MFITGNMQYNRLDTPRALQATPGNESWSSILLALQSRSSADDTVAPFILRNRTEPIELCHLPTATFRSAGP